MRPEEVICIAKGQEQLTELKAHEPTGAGTHRGSAKKAGPGPLWAFPDVIYLCQTALCSWLCDPHLRSYL